DYLYWREEQSSFQDIAAWYGTSIVVSGMGGHAQHRNGAYISSNVFPLVGVHPALGRGFNVGDESLAGEPVVIISDEIWRNRYSSDPRILGQAIRINGGMMVVIGVMPEGFRFPSSQDFWLPLPDRAAPRIGLQTFGRLKENVTLKQAQAELDAIARQLAAEYPATNEGIGITARRYIDAYTDAELRGYLNIMMAVVFGVLVVACANVANLLLARAALRVQELAVRRILGAGRPRLIMRRLVVGLLVAGTGGVRGLVMALLGTGRIHKAVKPFLLS
ncbi:MAG: hypothetical protein GY835_03835, partial [bacterium]|nr:hypothetical protein [bacterium]